MALAHSDINPSLSNCTLYVVLCLIRFQSAWNSSLCSTASRVFIDLRSSAF